MIILTDDDGDGTADRSTIFADELLMPTGLEIGDGGAYVASSHELLHFRDHDGDGRADERRVVLAGFGTEDTHHLIHTFRWGPDGFLYFNQSIYIHSHVETPYGVKRLNGGGIWQFRPDTLELDVFLYGMCNPWGHHVDRWGQNLGTDGAGFDGVQFLIPGATCRHAPSSEPILSGLNPHSPKYCGAEFISGRHFPPEWSGRFVTGDFRANRVSIFELAEDGSGFAATKLPDLIHSKHVAFRPIDMKMGPDGALYIADWYNPIIQHGEVSFRDPRQESYARTHLESDGEGSTGLFRTRDLIGRRFRCSSNPSPPPSSGRDISRNGSSRRGIGRTVLEALDHWLAGLDQSADAFEHRRVEALWLRQTLRAPDETLLRTVLASPEPRAREAGVRVLSYWHPFVRGSLDLLSGLTADPAPRVRLEAVRALSRLGTARSAEVATAVLDHRMDTFLDYALQLTLREQQSSWLAAFERGDVTFDGRTERIEYALRASGSKDVAAPLRALVSEGKVPTARQGSLVETVARLGDASDLRFALDAALDLVKAGNLRDAGGILAAIETSARQRGVRPEGSVAALGGLLRSLTLETRVLGARALRLAGALRAVELRGDIESIARDASERSPTAELRAEALRAIADFGDDEAKALLLERSGGEHSIAIRLDAIEALAQVDVEQASARSTELLERELDPANVTRLIRAILGRKSGATALASRLAERRIPPDNAKIALRASRDAGTIAEELSGALRAAGQLAAASELTAEGRRSILEDLGTGTAIRPVERRSIVERICAAWQCHAIGGAGGRVGPDLSTIGASAPVDYLLDSLVEPQKAVKENYHAVSIVTKTGAVVTGVKVRDADREIVVRDADDRVITVARDTIAAAHEAGSIMPVGLVDELTRAELIDLTRFLSELGKSADYAVGSAQRFRTWDVLDAPAGGLECTRGRGRREPPRATRPRVATGLHAGVGAPSAPGQPTG